jgi:hypothetical protein
LTNMQKFFFEILVQTALTVGLFWTILKLPPKSALLSFPILYSLWIILKLSNLRLITYSLR